MRWYIKILSILWISDNSNKKLSPLRVRINEWVLYMSNLRPFNYTSSPNVTCHYKMCGIGDFLNGTPYSDNILIRKLLFYIKSNHLLKNSLKSPQKFRKSMTPSIRVLRNQIQVWKNSWQCTDLYQLSLRILNLFTLILKYFQAL